MHIFVSQKLAEKVQDAMAKANEVSEETCSSMRTVRSFASEDKEAERYKEKMALMFGLNMKEAFVYAGYMWSNNVSLKQSYYILCEVNVKSSFNINSKQTIRVILCKTYPKMMA